MVWEWFLDVELADTPNRYSQAVAYLRGEVGSSSLRILCLAYGAAIETAYQLDDNESFDCPFDWEVIPAAMRLEFDSGCTLLLESSPQEVFEALKIELAGAK
jgi:hypothetical protein